MIYEVDDFDIGDSIKIDVGGETLIGEILKINETRIQIKKRDGLKAVVPAEKIRFVEQVADDYCEGGDCVSQSQTTLEISKNISQNVLHQEKRDTEACNINELYESMISPDIEVEDPWTYEELREVAKTSKSRTEIQGLIDSVGSAIKNDKVSLDKENSNNKTKAPIVKLKEVYEKTREEFVLNLLLYIYYIQTDKNNNKNSTFAEGIKYANEQNSEIALRFFRRQGSLPYALECWKEYVSLPEQMIYVIEKSKDKEIKSKEGLEELGIYVNEICQAANLSNRVANLLLYGVLKRLKGDLYAKTNFGSNSIDNVELRQNLTKSIIMYIEEIKKASQVPIAVQKNNSKKGVNTKLTWRSSYAVISKNLQNAKTEDDYCRMVAVLKDVITYNSEKTFTAVSDLMSLYSRKAFGKYKLTIETYEKYKGNFNTEERIKLAKLALPAYMNDEQFDKCLTTIDEIYKETAEEQYLPMKVICLIKKKQYDEALNVATKIKTGKLNPTQYLALQQNICAIYVLKGEYENAQKIVDVLRYNGESVDYLQRMIDSAITPNNTDDEKLDKNAEAYLEDIVAEVDIASDAYRIDDLMSSFIRSEIEKCEYEGVKNRRQNPQTGKMELNPEDRPDKTKSAEEYISTIFNTMKNEASYKKSNEVLYGKFNDAATKWLTLAKISEQASKAEESYELDWVSRFIESIKTYLWLRGKLCKESSSSLFYTKEYLVLVARTMNSDQKLTFEVYDALNNYLAYWGGLEKSNYTAVDYSKYCDDDDYERSQLQIIGNTLEKAMKCKSVEVIFALLELPKNMYTAVILPIINKTNIASDIKNIIAEHFNREGGEELTEILEKTNSILQEHRYQVKEFISKIAEILGEGETANTEKLRIFINDLQEHLAFITRYDRDRGFKLANICNKYYELLSEDGYSRVSSIYSTIIGLVGAYRAETVNSPLEIDYYDTDKIVAQIASFTETIYEKCLEKSLPNIEIRDEYEFEGYHPKDCAITLMLEVLNGKPGEDRSQAILSSIEMETGNIQFSVQDSPNCKNDVIRGGEYNNYEFDLLFSPEVVKKGDPVPATIKVNYMTVSNQIKAIECLINISFSQGEFSGITNVYDENELSPNDGKELFMGRDAIINSISNMLVNGNSFGRTVFIYGMFRSGKSSLKNFIAEKLCRENGVILADVGTVITNRCSTFELLKDILNKIIAVIKENSNLEDEDKVLQAINILKQCADSIDENNYSKVAVDFMRKFVEHKTELNYPHILLTFDEIGRHFLKYPDSDFMEIWKDIMTAKAIDAIFVGHDIITKIMRESSNPFGTSTMYQIDYIDEEASSNLIKLPTAYTENGETKYRFTEDATRRIRFLGGGHVYYLQLICSACVNYMNANKLSRLNASYVNKAIEDWINNIDTDTIIAKGHSLYEAGEFGSREVKETASKKYAQIVLDAISNLGDSSNSEQIKLYAMQKYRLSEAVTEEFLANLVNRRVIYKSDNIYYIKVKFYTEYLNEYIADEIE